MGASHEQEEPLWSEVDCGQAQELAKELGITTKLGNLSHEQRLRLYPLMRPTDEQLQKVKGALMHEGGAFIAAAMVPSSFLPSHIEKMTLGQIVIRDCTEKEA